MIDTSSEQKSYKDGLQRMQCQPIFELCSGAGKWIAIEVQRAIFLYESPLISQKGCLRINV